MRFAIVRRAFAGVCALCDRSTRFRRCACTSRSFGALSQVRVRFWRYLILLIYKSDLASYLGHGFSRVICGFVCAGLHYGFEVGLVGHKAGEFLAHGCESACGCLTDGELDAVFSNPPYMKVNAGKRNDADEKYIARHEVFGGIYDFCSAAARLLKFGGRFYCVYRPDRLSELMDAMHASKLEPKRMTFVHPDEFTSPSAVLIEAKKGAAPSMKLTAPLIIHKEKATDGGAREMTDRAKKIYDTCNFEDFD